MVNIEKLTILYGSQYGNAQDLAKRVWKRAKQCGIKASLSSFDLFHFREEPPLGTTFLCICSTTGQGDVPDNMTQFWKFLMRKSVAANYLQQIQFAMIGLGDSSYEKYNFTAKKLYKRFVQLGAKPLLELCLCDDQQTGGIEETYSKWIVNFWSLIEVGKSSQTRSDEWFSTYTIHNIDTTPDLDSSEQIVSSRNSPDASPASETKPFNAKLVKNERVTPIEHSQNVRFIEFEVDSSQIKYEAGDVLMLRPSNLKENVDLFLKVFEHLSLNAHQRIRIVSQYADEIEIDQELDADRIRTVGDLVAFYFDLNSIPRMSFFENLSLIARDEQEKEKLREFMTPEGLDDLYNYCYRPRRTLIEILNDFPRTAACITSVDMLLDLIPAIKPRAFSIASSPHLNCRVVQVLVAVVEYKTRLFTPRRGTCSYWLGTLQPTESQTVPIWIKKGSFKIDWSRPIVCIGPGTGVAPFRSIINERLRAHKAPHNHLYFGCRSSKMDNFFESEWLDLSSEFGNDFLRVSVAFSRDQPQKVYVQDKLLEDSELVFDLIHHKNASIFIAGNSKRMPQDVLAIIEAIVAKNLPQNDSSATAAKEYVMKLEASKRIQLETWS